MEQGGRCFPALAVSCEFSQEKCSSLLLKPSAVVQTTPDVGQGEGNNPTSGHGSAHCYGTVS